MFTTIFVAAKLLALLIGLLGGITLQPVTQPAATGEQPAIAESTQPSAEATTAEITDVDTLLRALETAGDGTRLFSATVGYFKEFSIQGDTQRRDGRLIFASEPGVDGQPQSRRFGITFDRFQAGQRVDDRDSEFLEQFIFDGEWLAEIRPFDKQFMRRQVVPPGERWDPLRIGEGPFLIPIQQKREDILARFDAELLDGADGVGQRSLMGVAGKCYQLKLTPRADAGESELTEVRVWYQKDTLLPRIARTINRAEDISTVVLRDLRLNSEVDVRDGELSTEPPANRTGWDITIEPYRE